MKVLLWLDDYRNPHENNWLVFSPIEQPFKTVWVKNYDQFVDYLMYDGLPDAICFDHDLDPNQGLPGIATDEKTGMDCAKFLVEYCMNKKLPLPKWNIQSANPVGKENIDGLLKGYKKHEIH